ncbi:hypothetical protein [Pseudomonas sp. URMO17WK12:I4]|uniref:hypothetical protein n=1 Tax=Pseudomonas sp. URMO17WK12:I4 TaxID=1283292 RepID=UPI000484C47F|nr:hypothetical protein [Pseudomonas sp. URMO17WK12:I4]
MTATEINLAKLANCSALAKRPNFYTFALNLTFLLEDSQHLELATLSVERLKGMTDAYREQGLLNDREGNAIIDELSAYVRELKA